jgi:hypothetical protein
MWPDINSKIDVKPHENRQLACVPEEFTGVSDSRFDKRKVRSILIGRQNAHFTQNVHFIIVVIDHYEPFGPVVRAILQRQKLQKIGELGRKPFRKARSFGRI